MGDWPPLYLPMCESHWEIEAAFYLDNSLLLSVARTRPIAALTMSAIQFQAPFDTIGLALLLMLCLLSYFRLSRKVFAEFPRILRLVILFLTWLNLLIILGTVILRLLIPYSFAMSALILLTSLGLSYALCGSNLRISIPSRLGNLATGRLLKRQKLTLLVLFLSLGTLLVCLVQARTSATITHPLSNVRGEFYVATFLAVTALGLILLSRTGIDVSLISLATSSMIIASFSLIIYPSIFGTDIWAYLVNLRWLYDGNTLPRYQTLFTGANLYGGIYSLNLTFAEFLRLDPYTIVWYPWEIMQSFLVPVLVFGACWYLTRDRTVSLLTSAFSLTMYSVFIWNSLPSANAIGRVFMLFAITTWLAFATEKSTIALPTLATIGAITVYPLTGMYALVLGTLVVTARLSNCNRKVTMLAGAAVFPFLPAFMTLMPAVSQSHGAPEILVVVSRLFMVSPAYGLNPSPIDIGTVLVSVLSLFGLFYMYRQCSRDRWMFAALLSIVFVLAQAALSDLMSAPTLRIHTTVLPFFMLMAASFGLKQFRAWSSLRIVRFSINQKRYTPAIRCKAGICRKIAAGLFLTILVIGSMSLYIFMPVRGPNASNDLIRAVSYVAELDPSHDALIVADQLGSYTLAACARGNWYGLAGKRFGEPLIALSSSRVAYYSMLKDPQEAREYVREAEVSTRQYLFQAYGVQYVPTRAFVIYNPFVAGLSLQEALETKLGLDSVLGPPSVFGTVFVYVVRLSTLE